jgi:hypothetical protein
MARGQIISIILEDKMNIKLKNTAVLAGLICLTLVWAPAQEQLKTRPGTMQKPVFRRKPNLCIETSFSIGNRNVLWGDDQTVTLTPKDAFKVIAGKAAFNLRYVLKNLKDGGASGFRNEVLFRDQLVGQQTNLSVGAAVSSVPVWTQVYLPIQEGVLKIKIDAGNQVDEEWEGDNEVWLHVKFAGF